jgi:anti-sigma regulatory factor (Ser/Thr protein kinase)
LAEPSPLPANHTILLYGKEDDLLASLVPFVEGGIDAGEGVIAVALPENLRALRDALGRTPPWVRFVDAADWYSRPADTMGRWVSFAVDQLAVGRPGIRIIGEVFWPEDPLCQLEMRRFEAASTLAWKTLPALVLCPYKKPRYSRAVIEAALASHPGVIEDGVASLSPTHVPPDELVRATLPVLQAPGGASSRRFEPSDVVPLAVFVEAAARRARVDERGVQRLVAAATDVAANAFAHAGGPVDVTTWEDGVHVVFQLEDGGLGIADPGVGYQPPYAGDDRWGLWLARRRTDLLEVGRSGRGTAVRLRASRRLRATV